MDVTINNSTISENQGGGLSATNGTTVLVTNSTISNNQGDTGGAIAIGGGAHLTLLNSTVTSNHTVSGASVQTTEGGQYVFSNSIIAGNTGAPNCAFPAAPAPINNGHNLEDGTSCGFGSANGNLSSTNPQLGPLADNGGPTKTHALLPGSPAIDTGDSSACPATDQRGVSRPQMQGCDIGAFEREPESQAITFAPLQDKELGDARFVVSATASSGLPVSFAASPGTVCTASGNSITLVAGGSCTVTASQSGDATHAAAPSVSHTFAVKVALTVTTQGAGMVSPDSGSYGVGMVREFQPIATARTTLHRLGRRWTAEGLGRAPDAHHGCAAQRPGDLRPRANLRRRDH